MKRLVFTVTNDLVYDQRMIRICTSLSNNYDVLLIGRELRTSPELKKQQFKQKRLKCFFEKGIFFYLEYNIRLFFFLLQPRYDLICTIDLDTILPCYFVSILKNKKRIYDAHELFCEMKEVVTRKHVYKVWSGIENWLVPKFKYGYTVNTPIRDIFLKKYNVSYEVIRNVPFLLPLHKTAEEKFIIYQGSVNHGRSFETLIPAFKYIDVPLHIYGDGNFLKVAEELVHKYQLGNRVIFKGKADPEKLKFITPSAIMGITIFENNGLSNYLSLANRFFDYIHAGIPQICVDYPAYREINDRFKIAKLISDLSPRALAMDINELLYDQTLQMQIRENCLIARQELNWQNEEMKLLAFYKNIFSE